MMDSNDQEKERGITILAKNAAINYKDIKVNIVDTPGHADFGGEVERVLNMVDGVLLLVDAAEGPKPQTRFVLKKALALGLKVLVVVNKIDKPAARPEYVIDKTFDLFCELGANDEQTDFPIVYCSAINRIAGLDPNKMDSDMNCLLDAILEMPKPKADVEAPLQLQVSNIGSDPFIGRLGIGRIRSGVIRKNSAVAITAAPGEKVNPAKISELFTFDALGRTSVEEAGAGDIVVFSGLSDFNIGHTLVDPANPMPLEPIAIETPTMSVAISVNKSPFAGKSGKLLTSRNIRERLEKELETNVALQVKDTDDSDTIQVDFFPLHPIFPHMSHFPFVLCVPICHSDAPISPIWHTSHSSCVFLPYLTRIDFSVPGLRSWPSPPDCSHRDDAPRGLRNDDRLPPGPRAGDRGRAL